METAMLRRIFIMNPCREFFAESIMRQSVKNICHKMSIPEEANNYLRHFSGAWLFKLERINQLALANNGGKHPNRYWLVKNEPSAAAGDESEHLPLFRLTQSAARKTQRAIIKAHYGALSD